MKTKLLVSALVATAVAAPAAYAKVSISGQVNQAVILSGSEQDDIEVVDNGASGSRFRFKASKKFGDLTFGTRYEMQAQDNNGSTGEDRLISEVRYSDVWVKGAFGKLAIGKGDGAANGTFESYGLLGHYLGGDEGASPVKRAATINYSAVDGTSRENRVRYDSPNFSGFKFAVSLDNGDRTEIAGQYQGKIAGGTLRARVGDVSEEDITSYSIAYKTSFGLGLAYSYGEKADFDSELAVIAYQFGKTVAQYAFGEDSDGDELSIIGLNYKPVKGVEIYLNRVDSDNADGTEGDATYLGSRVKF